MIFGRGNGFLEMIPKSTREKKETASKLKLLYIKGHSREYKDNPQKENICNCISDKGQLARL